MPTQTTPGVKFRETMTGGFMLGETDPRTGEKKGDEAGIKLSIHCDINIRDVYAFINDPQHYAPISGQVDFPPFGMNIPAPSGLFNLFSPSNDPKLKHMVYELAFEHQGKPYYLAGKKDVRDDPGFDWWDDITTNYTRIHEGNDTTGKIVAAGVIYIGRQQLKELIPTIRATNTSSPAEELKVLADFGHFFFGSVWDTFSKLKGS